MNHTSIKKISLTTLALVAALAVSARANGPVMSAREHHGAAMPQHSMARVLLPDEVYQIDDGSAEDAVGLTLGGDVIVLNQFDVIAGSETITSINMAWGTPAFPDPSLNGLHYTAVLWDDPNGDRSPTDSTVLATVDGVVANQGTDTFIDNPITPTTIVGSSFFIGYIIQDTIGGQFPCAFDESAPIFNRSWVAGGATGDINNLNNNDLPVALIESFGLLGNWLCRADAGGGGGDIVLTANVRRQGGNRVVALGWSPADGGTVNVLRNGAVLHGPTNDDGSAQDNLKGHTGTFVYQVCETDTGTCSNEVTVKVRPGGN